MSNIKQQYIQSELTSRIIQTCIRVHNILGPGYNEVIYQRALDRELWKHQIDHNREVWLDIIYDGIKIGTKRVDFVIENVIVEIKAKAQFDPQDYFQTISYLKASRYVLALLVNFGSQKVEVKRFINQQSRPINR
ncbi:MAG: GxxExxY protein [Patescibacteria group bacterium]|jgi:GxxExxY protein